MAKTVRTTQGGLIDPDKTRSVAGKVTIYNVETGIAARRHPIDAKEQVKSGRWSYEPVTIKPEPKPTPQAETEAKPKRVSRGRKK